jgi:hypothetical protein
VPLANCRFPTAEGHEGQEWQHDDSPDLVNPIEPPLIYTELAKADAEFSDLGAARPAAALRRRHQGRPGGEHPQRCRLAESALGPREAECVHPAQRQGSDLLGAHRVDGDWRPDITSSSADWVFGCRGRCKRN